MMPSQNHTAETVRRNNDEHDNEIGTRHIDGASNAVANVCDTKRGYTSRRAISCVPYDRRDLGDFRPAVCKAEIDFPSESDGVLAPISRTRSIGPLSDQPVDSFASTTRFKPSESGLARAISVPFAAGFLRP